MASELAKWKPAFQHYAESEMVLDGLVRLFGSCPECASGGGAPDYAVHKCCREKTYNTCTECVEMNTCGRLKGYVQSLDALRGIKAIGVNAWAEEM